MEREPNQPLENNPTESSANLHQIAAVATPVTLTEFSDWLDGELDKLEAKWKKWAAPNASRFTRSR